MMQPVVQLQLSNCTSSWTTGGQPVECLYTVGWLEFNVPFQHKYGYITDGMYVYTIQLVVHLWLSNCTSGCPTGWTTGCIV